MSPSLATDRALLRQAMRAARAGDLPLARTLLVDHTQQFPDDSLGWLWRAAVAPTPELAYLWLRKLLDETPDFAPAQAAIRKVRLQAAYAALQKGESATARELFAEAAEAHSTDLLPWRALAHLAETPERKRFFLGEVLRREPDHEPARQALGELDAAAAAATVVPEPAVEAAPTPESTEAPRTILIVHADAAARGQLREELERLGDHVLEVPDAENAVTAIRQNGVPDLALVDAELPEIDGLQLGKYLHGSMKTATLPLVLLVAAESWWQRTRAKLAGFSDILVKPVGAERLEAVMNKLCPKRAEALS